MMLGFGVSVGRATGSLPGTIWYVFLLPEQRQFYVPTKRPYVENRRADPILPKIFQSVFDTITFRRKYY